MSRRGLALASVAAVVLTTGCSRHPGQDVRYEPTPMHVVRAMLDLAKVGPDDVVYDLGSGDGRIVITAAKEFGARGVGVEIHAPLVERARRHAREAGVDGRVEFRLQNMHTAEISDATVVTLFLHPTPNLELRPRLQQELRPGARVVSYMWDMDDWMPDESRRVGLHRVFLWRIAPGNAAGRNSARRGD